MYLQELLVILGDDDMLFDVGTNDAAAADRHLDGFIKNASRKCLHLPRERGAEHDRLTVRPCVVEDAHHLRFEAHVEHTISFVQNDISDTPQVCDTTCE